MTFVMPEIYMDAGLKNESKLTKLGNQALSQYFRTCLISFIIFYLFYSIF